MPAPVVPPEQVVGGPELARTGAVVLDRAHATAALPDTKDRSVLVADMDSGAILAAQNAHAWLYPASTLKTLLCLVVIPALDPTDKVVVTDEQARAEGSRVGLVPANSYTVDQLLAATILISGNDSAYALADAAGGREQTIARMNAMAGKLGAWDTVAVDPSGLDEPGQRSSAYDLALMGRAVMKLPAFRKWASTSQITFPGGVEKGGATRTFKPFVVGNHNRLFWNYDGTIGVKNGFTRLAQNTYIGAATRGGRTVLIVQMGHVLPSWQDSAALFDWGFANIDRVTPVGRLVDPGTTPRPAALGGPTISGASTTTATTPTPTGPAVAKAAPRASGGAALGLPLLERMPTGLQGATRWAVTGVGAVVLLVLALRLRVVARRRRRAGSYRS
jgi:D-alanyl-D-alanine carboxypeptidase (penicillin-binding protein 5/6)